MRETISVENLTKKDCFLCDIAKEVVLKVIQNFPVRLQTTDIESDPQPFEKYKEKIPIIRINGEDCFKFKVHEETLKKKLEQALAG